MRIAKIALAAAALTAAATLPAHADPTFQEGFNTGDAGAITVAVNSGLTPSRSGGGPGDGLLDAHCDFEQVNTVNNGITALVIAAHATAGPRGASRAVGTTIRCQITNFFTGQVVFDETKANEGSTAVLAPPPVLTTASGWRVCTEAWALYDSGAYVQTDHLRCIDPPH